MPKAQPHFDTLHLLQQVQAHDFGLRVSTNNPKGFRRVLYEAQRSAPHLRLHIYACPRSPRAFWLLKAPLPSLAPMEPSTEEDADNG